MFRSLSHATVVTAAISVAALAPGAAAAQELPRLDVTVFAPPSQSIWLPVLIQQLGLDTKHGFKLEVTAKPSRVAYADFATGADPVCYCSSISAVARFVEQGSQISLLWNIFDYDYYIVTTNSEIKTAKDLAGRTLLADTVTGSWASAAWLLSQSGLDLSSVQIRSTSGRGAAALAELTTGRVDALAANPTETATLLSEGGPDLKAFSIFDKALWARTSDAPAMPSIAFGVWKTWYDEPENAALARRFYAANVEAADYVRQNPAKAAALVAADAQVPEAALNDVFTRFPHLINIRPIADYRSAIAELTQKLLPEAEQLERPLTDEELKLYVSDFRP
ncbi:ABC transporter substrate-binding protein [Inquilinus limosus]|nr:ABC transporter substrate-binding protein [Inquilinus limosus]